MKLAQGHLSTDAGAVGSHAVSMIQSHTSMCIDMC